MPKLHLHLPFKQCIAGLNVILFPWMLLVAGVTAFLQSPVLALFSLPIFLPGFPRPRRFWPFREHCSHHQQQPPPPPPPPTQQQQQQCSAKKEHLCQERRDEPQRTFKPTVTTKGDVVFYAQVSRVDIMAGRCSRHVPLRALSFRSPCVFISLSSRVFVLLVLFRALSPSVSFLSSAHFRSALTE